MAMNIEFELRRMLQDPDLPPNERDHLEDLRRQNSDFIAQHKEIFPQSPYDFGPDHVKSLADLVVGSNYRVMVKVGNGTFVPFETILVERVSQKFEGALHGPHTIDIQAERSGGIQFTRRIAFEIGLEPIPPQAMRSRFDSKIDLQWVDDVYTARIPEETDRNMTE